MTQIYHDILAYRISDGLPQRQRDFYILAGTEGTDENDPRAVSVPGNTGNFIPIGTINKIEPVEDYEIFPEGVDAGFIAAEIAYQSDLDDARTDQESDNNDRLTDFLAAQDAAYDEAILLGFSVDAARFITRLDYPNG